MREVFISSSCIRENTLGGIISAINKINCTNIELSGGLLYSHNLLEEIKKYKNQGNTFLLHNYFPPPEVPFVFNLSSTGEIGVKSMQHAIKAIDWSKELGAKKLAFHAGFLIDIPVEQIGKPIDKQRRIPKAIAIENFKTRFNKLVAYAGDDLQLYIENNVLSNENFLNFEQNNPFLFTDFESWKDITVPGVKPLLDVAHLFVSCNSLGLDFEKNIIKINDMTDYIHISDNDGKSDLNRPIQKNGAIEKMLKSINIKDKTITLEIYSGVEGVKNTLALIDSL